MSDNVPANGSALGARGRIGRAVRMLLLPLSAIRAAHVWLVLFEGVVIASAIFGASELSAFAIREIVRAKIENREVRLGLYLAARTVPWLATFPLVLAALALPVRILWTGRGNFLSRAIEALAEAVSVCYRTVGVALSVLAIDLAPGFTLLAVHEIGIARLDNTNAMTLLLYAASLALFLGISKNAAVFFSPVVGVITLWDPYYSVDMAKEILRGTVGALAVVLVSGLCASLAVHYAMAAPNPPGNPTWLAIAAHSTIAWYTLTLTACVVAAHIDDKERLWQESVAASNDGVPEAQPVEAERIPFPF